MLKEKHKLKIRNWQIELNGLNKRYWEIYKNAGDFWVRGKIKKRMDINENKEQMDILEKQSKIEKEFIKFCVSRRMSYKEIAELLGMTKQTVYLRVRYGKNRLSQTDKDNIKKRDKYQCKICLQSFKEKKSKLHIHHISNPKDKSSKNLVSLCHKCHMKLEGALRSRKERELSTAEILYSRKVTC